VAYYRRFYPGLERIKHIIGSGEIGRPVLAQMQAFEWFDPPPDHPRAWLLDRRRAGGGPMMDFGCHRIEVLINLFGRVRRTAGIAATVAFDREVEDTAAAVMQFEAGVCATLAVTHASNQPRDTLDVFGTLGSVHAGSLNAGDVRVCAGGQERTESHPPAANLHRPLIDDFVDAVLTGRAPLVDGHVGRAVAEIEDVIYADTPSGS
jgi:predicted dehydrogenase